jgi:hypothetical protein
MEESMTETRYDKRDLTILGFEQHPYDTIVWVVYDEEMITGIKNRFIQLRGKDFVDDYVEVVSPTSNYKPTGQLYFDPFFYDHLNNGAH